ncbi:unnamed protein product [Polarella glacialis]|uniref:SEC7 domain-containing protein n=1 Tax=Polarella glacialis TaxID=89957 RepID=A0A813KF00_POLGL|nr:unnamed protein product [Polarella glacialis]CAE8698685.1 unnamed protein product [Polarella glacialis]
MAVSHEDHMQLEGIAAPRAIIVNFGDLEDKKIPLEPPESRASSKVAQGPPENVDSDAIYKLYRGATGRVHGEPHRVWVEFPALQLCWARYDQPAPAQNRVSLLDLGECSCQASSPSNGQDTRAGSATGEAVRVEIFSLNARICNQSDTDDGAAAGEDDGKVWEERVEVAVPKLASIPVLTVEGYYSSPIRDFAEALQQLLDSRDSEGKSGLEFIQARLFQYLWRHQGTTFTENELYQAQAVLAFNLDPKSGVAYLKDKLKKVSDSDIGEWLADMSTVNGGLDPTLLGNYFSRMDTIGVFKAFVQSLDFSKVDLVGALRKLFDTFKPGGEGQVISRIIELFAETYFEQWSRNKDMLPKTFYATSDDIMTTAFSLIMLNTGLHVATKKVKKNASADLTMSPEDFVKNTRRVVTEAAVPDEALHAFYDAVQAEEISMQPMPRAAFARLPVQPDIEGWLSVVQNAQVQRYWAVLALQRMYLFSDKSEVEPAEAIDLKDASACCVTGSAATQDRFHSDLQGGRSKCSCFFLPSGGMGELQDTDVMIKAFEVNRPQAGQGPALLRNLAKTRARLALVAESEDLMEKWVSLIDSGPY